MMRSLYAAVSGLQNHQTKMDVIGNNIANVNTIGFKRSRVTFQDVLSQLIRGASSSTAARGGTNPQQIGLGVRLGSTDNIFTQGNNQTTNKSTDLMVQGDGMFIVGESPAPGVWNKYYTRAGSFEIDQNGYLINASNGMKVLGWQQDTLLVGPPDINTNGTLPDVADRTEANLTHLVIKKGAPKSDGNAALQSFSIDSNGVITGVFDDGTSVQMGQIALANFDNPPGLVKMGESLYLASNNSGTPVVGEPSTKGLGAIIPGSLEMSNVDLSTEFTEMIITQRGFQANSRVITCSDEMLQELVNLKR